MSNVFKIVMGVILAVIVVALVYLAFGNTGTPTIEGGTFNIEKWNDTEYIENNIFTIKGGVVKENMESDNPFLFDAIVELESVNLNSDGTPRTYLVYFVDTLEREVGDEIEYESVVKVGTYLYEESADLVRTLPVYLSNSAIEYLQNR